MLVPFTGEKCIDTYITSPALSRSSNLSIPQSSQTSQSSQSHEKVCEIMVVSEAEVLSVDEAHQDSPFNKDQEAITSKDDDWSDNEEKALVRKVDWRVFPMLSIVFALCLLDRTNISAAYIAGMAEDIGLTAGSRYNIVLLVFFIGYAIFEIPSNLIIRHVGARWWLSFLVNAWGASVLGMGFVRSWISLAVCRALLGVFEAGLFPGAVFIIGSWYRQYETAWRVTLFYMGGLLASGFGPILAYVFSLIRVGDGIYRQPWRWIFIIEGLLTLVAGVLSPFFIVDFPEKTRWLNPREKHIAVARLQIDRKNTAYRQPSVRETIEMLWDWKLLVYSLQYFVAASNISSLVFFQPIILRNSLGFSYALAQLLTAPPYVFAAVLSLSLAWASDKYRTRWTILCIQSMAAVIGLLIVLYGKIPGVRYFGLFIATFGNQSNVPATLAYGQSQIARIEKRGLVAAAMITIGAIGGVCGSMIFRSQDAPRYLPGMWATIGMQLFYTAITFAMSMHLKRQNRLADEDPKLVLEGVEGFRYAP